MPINTYSSVSYTHTHTQTLYFRKKKAIGPPWKEQFFIPSPCGQHDASKDQTIVRNWIIFLWQLAKRWGLLCSHTHSFFHLHCSFWLFLRGLAPNLWWWSLMISCCRTTFIFCHLKYCTLSCCIVRLEASHHSLMYHTQWLPHYHEQWCGGYTQL